MQRISMKLVLTEKQKQQHVFVCQELLDEVKNNQIKSGFIVTTKQQSFQWKSLSSSCPRKAFHVLDKLYYTVWFLYLYFSHMPSTVQGTLSSFHTWDMTSPLLITDDYHHLFNYFASSSSSLLRCLC